jgi:hypothetical protein
VGTISRPSTGTPACFRFRRGESGIDVAFAPGNSGGFDAPGRSVRSRGRGRHRRRGGNPWRKGCAVAGGSGDLRAGGEPGRNEQNNDFEIMVDSARMRRARVT